MLHLEVRKNPNDAELQISYKNYRNTCNNTIQNLKNNFHRNELVKGIGDSKQTWKTLKRICGINSKTAPNSELIGIGATPLQSLNIVNRYFSTVGGNLANDILMTLETTESELAKNLINVPLLNESAKSFFLTPTNETEVIKIISSLKNKSSSGHDKINKKGV
ncbi:Uncharacterized protein OBRU01_10541 [Operophtera brumata]|uniref:Uncharacterized protein n=1 Tax=Operophtera brumata TaxID=104452 RepID=A0A0L7LDE6_OPEBR|nr:Uncharacterized protein OBRU01_10541 [Operophtera brumata]